MATGQPDWYRQVMPARSILAANQVRFALVATVPVSAGSNVSGSLYTIPAGYVLVIGYAKLSCSVSCIQSGLIQRDASDLGDMYFDTVLAIPLPESAAWYFEAGEVINATLYNNSASDAYFKCVLTGTMRQV